MKSPSGRGAAWSLGRSVAWSDFPPLSPGRGAGCSVHRASCTTGGAFEPPANQGLGVHIVQQVKEEGVASQAELHMQGTANNTPPPPPPPTPQLLILSSVSKDKHRQGKGRPGSGLHMALTVGFAVGSSDAE